MERTPGFCNTFSLADTSLADVPSEIKMERGELPRGVVNTVMGSTRTRISVSVD